eukprot:TRINITY_DN14882_c0_g1_i1.p1 TRINITY_DN14882_c0_g1~~TRINITY_DN14882_c0_g1_i1.p1  ORF type:complete len:265 (+),score=16.81 TRINITY_DN14882_c0_g1_i1:80-874(+)
MLTPHLRQDNGGRSSSYAILESLQSTLYVDLTLPRAVVSLDSMEVRAARLQNLLWRLSAAQRQKARTFTLPPSLRGLSDEPMRRLVQRDSTFRTLVGLPRERPVVLLRGGNLHRSSLARPSCLSRVHKVIKPPFRQPFFGKPVAPKCVEEDDSATSTTASDSEQELSLQPTKGKARSVHFSRELDAEVPILVGRPTKKLPFSLPPQKHVLRAIRMSKQRLEKAARSCHAGLRPAPAEGSSCSCAFSALLRGVRLCVNDVVAPRR